MKIITKAQIVSQNQFNNLRSWMGARKYTKYRNAWHMSLRKELVPIEPQEKCHTLVIVSHRKRLLDKGNLYGGSKPVPDVLKMLGYIYDDREAYLDEYCIQVKDTDQYTEIYLIEGFPLREKMEGFMSELLSSYENNCDKK